MGKMKVLMIGNHQSVKGGITSVIQQLLAYDWQSAGVDMEFVPTYIEASSLKKIVYFIRSYIRINKILRTNKPDIVHIHMSYKGSFYRKYILHKLCMRYKVPDIIHLHGSEFQKWYNKSNDNTKARIRTLLRESAAFIVLGEKWAGIIRSMEPKTKIVVVGNTVHIPDDTAGWNDNPFQILFLGVLIKRKGAADLIQAVSKLDKAGKAHNLKLVIAGSGAEAEELKRLSASLKLESLTEFAGWTEGRAKERYLKESQILVLPSYNEGLPIAVLEAISYGLPVIATDVGDVSAAVKDGENGFLIEPGDVPALADRIMRIAKDKNLYIKMSEKSRELAYREFSDNRYFEIIYKCYQDVNSAYENK